MYHCKCVTAVLQVSSMSDRNSNVNDNSFILTLGLYIKGHHVSTDYGKQLYTVILAECKIGRDYVTNMQIYA